MKKCFIFFLLYFCYSCFLVFASKVGKVVPVVDIKLRLPQLKELLKKNPEEFYKKSSQIRGVKISDKESAVNFYSLFSEYYFVRGNYDSASLILHEAREYWDDLNSDYAVKVQIQLANNFYFSGNFDSLQYYKNNLSKVIKKESPYYSEYLVVKGLARYSSIDYSTNISYLLEVIENKQVKQNDKILAIAFNNLAVLYLEIGDLDSYLKFMLRSIKINEDIGNLYNLVMNYNNLGSYYRKIDELELASEYYLLAYNELEKLNYPMLKAQNLTNRANIFEQNGDYTQAEKLFLACEFICEKHHIEYGKLLSALNLGNLYRLWGRFEQSEIKLNQGYVLALDLNIKRERALALQRMSWLERDRNNFKKAFDFQSRYQALNDSLVNESIQNQAAELNKKYESARKDLEIISLSDQKLQHQYTVVLMLVALLVLLVSMQWLKNKQRLTQISLLVSEEKNRHNQEVLTVRKQDLMEQTMDKIVLQQHLDDLFIKIEKNNNSAILQSARSIKKKNTPWDGMTEKFKMLHPEFMEKLSGDHPNLTRNDLELCSLIKMNLSTKEIAQIQNITVESVFTKKYRIAKKIKIDKDLSSWIHAL